MFLSELVVKHYDWNAHRRAEREQKTNFVRQEPRFFIDINPLEFIYDLPNKLSEEIASHNWLTDDPNSVYKSAKSLFDFLRKQRNIVDTILAEVQKHVTKDTYYEETVEVDYTAQRRLQNALNRASQTINPEQYVRQIYSVGTLQEGDRSERNLPETGEAVQQQVHQGRSLNSIAHPRQRAGQGIPVENMEIRESSLEELPEIQSGPNSTIPRMDGSHLLYSGVAARVRGTYGTTSRFEQEGAAAEVLRPGRWQAVGTPGENS